MREKVREMFTHAYDSYMRYAFPHDELKPLSRTWTDSLVELGNSVHVTRAGYNGVALTLIDSLDTLAVLGNRSEFARGVRWVSTHVSFDLDIDVHVFETTIRVLGGLLSAHLLAAGQCRGAEHMAVDGYAGELLSLAVDLGRRLLGAFDGCDRLPRAFVNLRGRVAKHARMEQCTAGVGTLLLEMGVLSRLSGEPRFEQAALCALRLLWSKRSSYDLVGNTLDVSTGKWRNPNAGIGAGIDSFYEYLLKGCGSPAPPPPTPPAPPPPESTLLSARTPPRPPPPLAIASSCSPCARQLPCLRPFRALQHVERVVRRRANAPPPRRVVRRGQHAPGHQAGRAALRVAPGLLAGAAGAGGRR